MLYDRIHCKISVVIWPDDNIAVFVGLDDNIYFSWKRHVLLLPGPWKVVRSIWPVNLLWLTCLQCTSWGFICVHRIDREVAYCTPLSRVLRLSAVLEFREIRNVTWNWQHVGKMSLSDNSPALMKASPNCDISSLSYINLSMPGCVCVGGGVCVGCVCVCVSPPTHGLLCHVP
jgi:hypothetical protein